MLELKIPASELFDEESFTFIQTKPATILLEHSLLSISKWESKWKKPFLSSKGKTPEETIDYIRCMTITKNVPDEVYQCLTNENLDVVADYVADSMTATWFREDRTPPSREVITSEVIYYWMITANIPMECQKWHLNRLLTLIRVCQIKNAPNKKMSKGEIARRNNELNAARLKQLNTSG